MTSSIGHLLLLLCLLSLSLQTHARESYFFSKASRSEASTIPIAEEPAMVLPAQSRNGYGLYGDIDQSPSSAATTNNFPSTSANTEYKEQSHANAIPYSTFSNEFSSAHEVPSESYENKEQPNASTIPSTFSNELNHHGSYGKYYYDVNSEGYSKEYRPMKENAEGYRSYVESGGGGNYVNGGNGDSNINRRNGYMYKNEVAEYQNNQANYENLEEYVP